jgi:hypothetical protein
MDFVPSALTGALRIGVQVVVARRRPVLDIFCNLHNDFSPPVELNSQILQGSQTHRFQNIFVDLVLVNLGGIRAENVTFKTAGNFQRHRNLPALFESTIWQMAPGQSHYLMRTDQGDIHDMVPDANDAKAHRMGGLKKDTLTVSVHYDGPSTVLNRILRVLRRWRGLKQYQTTFVFDPQIFAGDLPPPNYA